MSRHAYWKRAGLAGLALAAMVLVEGGRPARGDVKLPAIFGSHMVLQQGQKDRVWGRADPGEEVTVTIADQVKTTKADDDGKWSVTLDPLPAGGPHTLTVKGKNTITLDDVLVGEVWLCSGQSNMQLAVVAGQRRRPGDPDGEVSQDPPDLGAAGRHAGAARTTSRASGRSARPRPSASFSAVGYFFGRQLHQTLDVPIGLIDDSWGGSACEAWVRRDLLDGRREVSSR